MIEDIPTFAFMPDWSSGITERLEWLTAVLASPSASEQRYSARLTPRRTFDINFTLDGVIRQQFEEFLWSFGRSDFYLPLWHDIGTLDRGSVAGSQYLSFDAAYSEIQSIPLFAVRSSGRTVNDIEIGEIDTPSATGITTVDGLLARWPAGSKVMPLVKAQFASQPQITRRSDRVSQTQCRFQCTEKNGAALYAAPATYRSNYILETDPNEFEDLTYTYDAALDELDNQTGRRARKDTAASEFTVQQFSWTNAGRQVEGQVRSLLYYLAGRRVPIWIPSYQADFDIVAAAGEADNQITVEYNGYTDSGGSTRPNRNDILIHLRNGLRLYRRITGSANAGSTEILTLDSSLSIALTPDDVLRTSFLRLGRQDQDMIEFSHLTDNRGASTVKTVFRIAPQTRSVP